MNQKKTRDGGKGNDAAWQQEKGIVNASGYINSKSSPSNRAKTCSLHGIPSICHSSYTQSYSISGAPLPPSNSTTYSTNKKYMGDFVTAKRSAHAQQAFIVDNIDIGPQRGNVVPVCRRNMISSMRDFTTREMYVRYGGGSKRKNRIFSSCALQKQMPPYLFLSSSLYLPPLQE